ncbi:MAG TPA: SCO family protein [Candidatus Angelobacter sp.]|nr:SCO family protein [Candidatus Angelobacter sp.]
MNRRQFFANFGACSTDASLGPRYFTNAVFRTHENKEVRFYDDLIKGKHVVINFMYSNCQGTCPRITANLVKVQETLKKRIGQDIFMYSITIKPEEDNPATLREYAKVHGVKPGWLFLTADPYDIATVRSRIANWSHPGIDLDATQHTGMVRVINDSINRWFGCSALASLETIVQVIRWCDPIKPLEVRLRENAIAQAKIDQMEILPTWLDSLADS